MRLSGAKHIDGVVQLKLRQAGDSGELKYKKIEDKKHHYSLFIIHCSLFIP
jgi:hypothetical protein